MRINLRKKKKLTDEQLEIISTKDFFDRIVPGIIRFYTDHYICGNFYKSCWAVTEYPTSTEETAILAHLADRNGVTLRIYNRLVTSMEWFCQYHLTHFIRTRIMQRERYDHSRAFFELPEAAHRWRCRFFC